MFGMRGDHNAPDVHAVPIWGPDKSSRRLSVLNWLFASTRSPANDGIGTRPAPEGASESERTKSTTWLTPQQDFRGFAAKTVDPTIKNSSATAMLPSANAQIDPVLMQMSIQQMQHSAGGGYW